MIGEPLDEQHDASADIEPAQSIEAGTQGAGLMWGRQTNLAIAAYRCWWVVHLWVEGFLPRHAP